MWSLTSERRWRHDDWRIQSSKNLFIFCIVCEKDICRKSKRDISWYRNRNDQDSLLLCWSHSYNIQYFLSHPEWSNPCIILTIVQFSYCSLLRIDNRADTIDSAYATDAQLLQTFDSHIWLDWKESIVLFAITNNSFVCEYCEQRFRLPTSNMLEDGWLPLWHHETARDRRMVTRSIPFNHYTDIRWKH